MLYIRRNEERNEIWSEGKVLSLWENVLGRKLPVMESEKYGIEKRIHKLDVIDVAVNIIKKNFK